MGKGGRGGRAIGSGKYWGGHADLVGEGWALLISGVRETGYIGGRVDGGVRGWLGNEGRLVGEGDFGWGTRCEQVDMINGKEGVRAVEEAGVVGRGLMQSDRWEWWVDGCGGD
ncbi:hypothetical protein Tco_0555749 [Tanacetum coccineum]